MTPATDPGPERTPQRADLIGAWQLVRFHSALPDGRTVEPYGPRPLGTLIYTESGRMSAALCSPDRGDFGGAEFETAARASDEDKVRAFTGYTSYAGTFSVVGDEVCHDIDIALVPSMIGRRVCRTARLGAGGLLLSYTHGAVTSTLRWRRA